MTKYNKQYKEKYSNVIRHTTTTTTTTTAMMMIKLTCAQVWTIVRGYTDATPLRVHGLWLGLGLSFTLTRVTDSRVMVGRNAATGDGCVMYRANTCLIVAVYEEGNLPGACYTVVTKLGDFLVESGY